MFKLYQQSISHNCSRIELLILIALLTLTFVYRAQLNQAQTTNLYHKQLLYQLSSSLSKMQSQHQVLEQFYNNNYQQLLNIFTIELKNLNTQLNNVQQLYSINRNTFQTLNATKTLTPVLRLTRLQNILQQDKQIIDYLQNLLKDKIRQHKYSLLDQLSKDPYFSAQSMRSNWQLIKANLKSPFTTDAETAHLQLHYDKQQKRIQDMYHISNYPQELPFCIIVPSYNNAKNFRYQFNLQSILNQNYSNYHVVIVDDGSPDLTGLHIQHFLTQHNIKEDKVTLIRNQRQRTAVPNIHLAATKYCKSNEIGFFVDGDDELVGNQAFKIFNAIYQSRHPAIAYSMAFEYWTADQMVIDNWSQQYSEEEKKNNLYRDVSQKISHLRSFRIDLYLQINQNDLKDQNGQWFTSTYDQVICLPMLEMSCGKIQLIHQYLYLYIYGTGYNDRMVDNELQQSIARRIKNVLPKYKCDPRFLTT